MKTSLRLLGLIVVFAGLIVQAASVRLDWDANTEADLAGYKLYAGTNSAVYLTNYTVGKVTTLTLTNLANDITYYFTLTALNTASLESPPSNEVSFKATPPIVDVPPTSPGPISLIPRGPGKTALWFRYNEADAGSFKIYTNDVVAIESAPRSAESSPTSTIIDLSFPVPGISYSIQVSALGTNGAESARSPATVGKIPLGTNLRRD